MFEVFWGNVLNKFSDYVCCIKKEKFSDFFVGKIDHWNEEVEKLNYIQ